MRKKEIYELQDVLNTASDKLSFILDALTQPARCEFTFSKDGQFGLQTILNNVIDEIDGVIRDLNPIGRDGERAATKILKEQGKKRPEEKEKD